MNRLPMLDNSNLWDRTYTILKERIVKRMFSPGQKISIPEIADQLNVSRTPVRDALNRLEAEGLVYTKSKVGTYVVPIDEALISSAMDTRLMIELWAIKKLPECPPERFDIAIANMKTILAESVATYQRQPNAYFEMDYNLQFHLAFVRSAGNPNNDKVYESVMNYRLPVTAPSHVRHDEADTARRQHTNILNSFEKRDYLGLETMILEHLNDSKARVIQKIRSAGGVI